MDWTQRCEDAEIIDSPASIPPPRMAMILRELRLVNRYLGGATACLKAVKPIIRRLAATRDRPLRIADWGTGSADIPRALLSWGEREGLRLKVVALDFNLDACRHAARSLPEEGDRFAVVAGDVFRPPLRLDQVDVVMFSAFLHHFSQPQIIELLLGLKQGGVAWAVVNDLHRSRLAFRGIQSLTWLLSRSPEVRHDGPLSVRKGFRRSDLRELALASGCCSFSIAWRWAFRYSMQLEFETNHSHNVLIKGDGQN